MLEHISDAAIVPVPAVSTGGAVAVTVPYPTFYWPATAEPVCPHCGRCPHCGQRAHPALPYWPQPYIVWSGTC